MTSRYRVEYALKEHRRDGLIEWIKGLLAVPFVLYAVKANGISHVDEIKTNADAKRRYAEIFYDLERLVDDHIDMQNEGTVELSRLKQLVPSIGSFFTKLPLEKAFYIEDERRTISKRRQVAPSFNDIRLILNTAQILQLSFNFHSLRGDPRLKLMTFDGDVTLYDDGNSFESDSPILPYLITLLSKDIYIGIVTAAGYSDESGEKYYGRLKGLVDEVGKTDKLKDYQRENLLVMGGESNYLFRYNNEIKNLKFVTKDTWFLEAMFHWKEDDIVQTLDFAEEHLRDLIVKLSLPAVVMRKERGVGIVPIDGIKLWREQLEEVVLRIDKMLKVFPPAKNIRVCAFNGGNDVWVDIGDKSLGVQVLQKFLNMDENTCCSETLHVGDQFSALGANDFKARLSGCTVWVASPDETEYMLRDLIQYINDWAKY